MRENDETTLHEVYSNHVQVGMTAYDLSLTFGIADGAEPRNHTVVRMSPHHAKSLMLLLEKFMSIYEREMSPVKLPPKLEGRTPTQCRIAGGAKWGRQLA